MGGLGSLQNLFRHRSQPISFPLSEERNSHHKLVLFYYTSPQRLPSSTDLNSWAQMKQVRRENPDKMGPETEFALACHLPTWANSQAMFSCSSVCRQQRSWSEWILPHGVCKLQRLDHAIDGCLRTCKHFSAHRRNIPLCPRHFRK
jgi:hypothetical protein